MPYLTIDGERIEFEKGETIIRAAERNNIEIPYYCWHPRLSVAANCRMCLVEVESCPKLVPACQTECQDGMIVNTKSQKVKATQQAVHEFILINHPIDCPICDQAGECKLQDYYMQWDKTQSRMQDAKVNKPRHNRLGPYIIYNAERCIMCTLCVRFMEEIAGMRQLGIFNRGDHSEIDIFSGQPLDHPYSLNTVDICPVGALTSTVFRFKQRVWNLKRSASICNHCARGCNIYIDQRAGNIYRFIPRENEAVNQSWLCDEGRLAYSQTNQRLAHALIKSSSTPEPTVSDCNKAKQRAVDILAKPNAVPPHLGAMLSLHATCEEAYVFIRLLRDVFGVTKIALLEYNLGTQDSFLRLADKNPNRAGIMIIIKELGVTIFDNNELLNAITNNSIKTLIVLGHEGDNAEVVAKTAAKANTNIIHLTSARGPLSEVASVTLPILAWPSLDGVWVNADLRAQCLTPAFTGEGDSQPSYNWLINIATCLGANFNLNSIETIRDQITQQITAFAKINLANIPSVGVELA
ncbi:MAG: (2Fe-2S)-binding protein [Deltaproteobacteria bacterium]|nr:(2Fe-2S)-binding protein [Deltaproteobacteria bacterium]